MLNVERAPDGATEREKQLQERLDADVKAREKYLQGQLDASTKALASLTDKLNQVNARVHCT